MKIGYETNGERNVWHKFFKLPNKLSNLRRRKI